MSWLVLMRRDGEGIKIGEDIKVRIKNCSNGHCSVAIQAPKGIIIMREELL